MLDSLALLLSYRFIFCLYGFNVGGQTKLAIGVSTRP
jgi:hypothetical protein